MPAPTVIAAPGRLRPGGAAGAVHMTVSASRSRSPSRLAADAVVVAARESLAAAEAPPAAPTGPDSAGVLHTPTGDR